MLIFIRRVEPKDVYFQDLQLRQDDILLAVNAPCLIGQKKNVMVFLWYNATLYNALDSLGCFLVDIIEIT